MSNFIIGAIVALLAALFLFLGITEANFRDDCRSKGGVPMLSGRDWVCLDPKVTIK